MLAARANCWIDGIYMHIASGLANLGLIARLACTHLNPSYKISMNIARSEAESYK